VRLRERPAAPPPGDVMVAGSERRPVVLATLAVPFEPEAFRVALQAAMESGVTLIVVDAVELPFWPQSIATRHADTELDSDRARIKELVSQAASLGVEVEHLRVRSPQNPWVLLAPSWSGARTVCRTTFRRDDGHPSHRRPM